MITKWYPLANQRQVPIIDCLGGSYQEGKIPARVICYLTRAVDATAFDFSSSGVLCAILRGLNLRGGKFAFVGGNF